MSKENIKIIQNILKQQNKYDLAIKLENSHYEDYKIDNWNGGIGEVNIFVHPNYFFELHSLDEDTRDFLLKILGLDNQSGLFLTNFNIIA
ncbi:MAG: hypothetical protein K2Y14_03345 [Burkholderiales bacterium]|nr:hypothetical protein [Burkholderiales bacterium]